MNYKLTVAYDGTRYRGWQRLGEGAQSIQGKLEAVLSRMEGRPVEVHGAGRTDAGVHALGQVASVRLSEDRGPGEIMDYVNRYLPEDIGVLRVEEVPPRFHARLTPSQKTYRYRIWASPLPCVFERRWCCCPERIPDAGKMAEAAPLFLGRHDFAAFQAAGGTARTTVRTIDRAELLSSTPEITLIVSGNAFLYNMVRAMVGTCVYASEGKLSPDEIPSLLDGKNRTDAGPTAPPQGLYMTNLWYPIPGLPYRG